MQQLHDTLLLHSAPMTRRITLIALVAVAWLPAAAFTREPSATVLSIGVIDAQLSHPGQSLERLMGSELVAAKTVNSSTLFVATGLESAGSLLDWFGRHCTQTLARLS